MRLWVVSPLVKGRRSVELPTTARVKELRKAVREQLALRRRILLFWGKVELGDPEQSLSALGLRHDSTVSAVAKLGSGLIGRLDGSESTEESQPELQMGPTGPAGGLFVPVVLVGEAGAEETSARPERAESDGAAGRRWQRRAAQSVWEEQRRQKGSALAARLLARQPPRAVVSAAAPSVRPRGCLCQPRPSAPPGQPCPRCRRPA